jgi:23S rRNA (adenine2503-C2)-methyltransferase
MIKSSFYDYSLDDLKDLFSIENLPSSGPGLLYNWHYKKRKIEPCLEDLAKKSISFVQEKFNFNLPKINHVQEAEDKTVKFLIELDDLKKVETVLIPFQNKYTVCISSQVGCSMKCSFCFTGTQGLTRNLTTSEIIGQFLRADQWLNTNRPNDNKILNVVFMGQGEPLHNFDAVKKACEIFISQHGLSLARNRITISTAGYLPGLERWKNEMPDVNIALSLHSVIKAKRDQLIPINQRYPLDEIMKYIEQIPEGKKRFVIYEYLLVKDFNDSIEDAHLTGKFLQGKKASVNLIPFNPYPNSIYKKPEFDVIREFKAVLDQYQIPTMIRTTKGDEILAACGQLNTKF